MVGMPTRKKPSTPGRPASESPPSPPAPEQGAKKPNRSGRAVNVWVSDAHAAAIDAFMAKHRLPPTLTSVVELALEEFFKAEGCWPK